jgi:hypothetical protein
MSHFLKAAHGAERDPWVSSAPWSATVQTLRPHGGTKPGDAAMALSASKVMIATAQVLPPDLASSIAPVIVATLFYAHRSRLNTCIGSLRGIMQPDD